MTFTATSLLLSTLFGAVIGMRLNVMALVPGLLIAVPATAGVGAVAGETLSATTVALLVAILGLQIGYFAGIMLRTTLALARLSRMRASKSATGQATIFLP
jgi:membrane protein DedA with SNARE-associated domain